MRRISLLFAALLLTLSVRSQEISRQRMEEVYEAVKTPYKYGLVIAPEDNVHKADCPTVFRHDGRWYMSYVVYNGKAREGRGYETWLAESDNLLEWRTLGRMLSYREEGAWDCHQRGGFMALQDLTWGGSYALRKYKGRYWMTYMGGNTRGYESAPLSIALASTRKAPSTAHEWESPEQPALSSKDPEAQWFEKLIQYKSSVFEDPDRRFGKRFVMFYNAGGINPANGLKAERIGLALSDDMVHWERYAGNPVYAKEQPGTITGDAWLQRMDDLYVMFYFGAFREDRPYKAFNTFACSRDLLHWTDWEGEDLIYPTKRYDARFAHKSCVICHEGIVYHFYCAVSDDDQRGIAVATSRPLGRSKLAFPAPDPTGARRAIDLNRGWRSRLTPEQGKPGPEIAVDLPHNWDDYYGYRNLLHGNLHGSADYTRTFDLAEKSPSKRYFLRFEGVGTYATVTLNGCPLGRHIAGRTVLTLDVTEAIRAGANTLTVRAEHPSLIADMPWVCGGCSSEWGFSEGSQPLGIFRPVTLEITDRTRIEPFGTHIWNEADNRTLHIETEVKNYGDRPDTVEIDNRIINANLSMVARLRKRVAVPAGATLTVRQDTLLQQPRLWSAADPYCYTLTTLVRRGKRTVDEVNTTFGIRTVSFPALRQDGDPRLYVNGRPEYLNGVCEYEHLLGGSHAFSEAQIESRAKQVRNAGFNAFRDAHQPHNLRYGDYWDRHGIYCWTQFSAHIWYDTPEFRENFKTLLRRWVKERRNSPAVILWGLQNESTLPADFAAECTALIRELDPTACTMRPVTTCNGGSGTDWNVVQNWSGTYGGDPQRYGEELAQPGQLLNGEYGAWRSIDLHTEGEFDQQGPWSENRFAQLLEMKIGQAEGMRDRVIGQFQWCYTSHDNPGRRQPDEGYRTIDKIGPCNYKGLVTPWEEPTDAWYMYRGNYADPDRDPMVYIVSHTWTDRFSGPATADLEVYSNCDSVALYNSAGTRNPLGTRTRGGIGTHFVWSGAEVRCNVLHAVGYRRGRTVCEDRIVLQNLPEAPDADLLTAEDRSLERGAEGYRYLYRINCGGDRFTDRFGAVWEQDNTHCSTSWGDAFDEVGPYTASQRVNRNPIRGTRSQDLFGHYRYGRHRLQYRFAVPDGHYRIELYFAEPFHGLGAPLYDGEGLRLFDVAVNGRTVIDDLDLFAEEGCCRAAKRVVEADAADGAIVISFPEVKAGQAVISAIAVATTASVEAPEPQPVEGFSWAALEQQRTVKTDPATLPAGDDGRQAVTLPAAESRTTGRWSPVTVRKKEGLRLDSDAGSICWEFQVGLAQIYAFRFNYMNTAGRPVEATLTLTDAAGTAVRTTPIHFPEAAEKWRMVSSTSGSFINAGAYRLTLTVPEGAGLAFQSIEIQ